MIKALVTGASGMVGSALCPELVKQGYQVHKTDMNNLDDQTESLDVRDIRQVENTIRGVAPDWIIHLAAETDVDRCELEKNHAFQSNTIGTENIALACQKRDIPLVYISTAGVFDGRKKTPYHEWDKPEPVNVYGWSKLGGEFAVMHLLRRWVVARAGWMVGGYEKDKKFVNKIVAQIQAGAKEIYAVSDKFGSPTFTWDFAKNLIELIRTERYGLYHLTNRGTCSRYEVAKAIVECAGLEGSVKVFPCSSDRFPLPASRADSEMMDNLKLELLGLNRMRFWQEALREYIKGFRLHRPVSNMPAP